MPLGLYRDPDVQRLQRDDLPHLYAALGAGMSFFLVLQLQTVGGYNALEAGLATLPITICMLFLAARGGELGTPHRAADPDDGRSPGDRRSAPC